MNPRRFDLDIPFSLDGISMRALNITYECFRRTIPSHSHGSGCYEIHYIPSGCGKLTADGQNFTVTPNTLYVTGPHVEHAQTPLEEDPMQEYCVYLKIRPCRQRKTSPVMDLFVSTPFWFGKDTHGIHGIMRQLSEEMEHRPFGYRNQAGLLLSQLIISIVRNYESRPSRALPARKNLSDLNSVIIEEYFLYEYRELSLGGLAHRLKLSPRQTQRLLMEYYGKCFQKKKAEAKMSAAAILLADQEKSITSIAEDLGYSSAEHFSSAFRKYYGTSPREYRKLL